MPVADTLAVAVEEVAEASPAPVPAAPFVAVERKDGTANASDENRLEASVDDDADNDAEEFAAATVDVDE